MKKLTQEQLNEVLRRHRLWLEDKEGGERADLSNTNLSNTNLCHADLSYADLSNVNLSYANLRCAYLQRANLSDANLRDATLSYANLRYANLQRANLSDANLRDASLSDANLSDAVVNLQCPEKGSFTAFKKCRDNRIVELFIPPCARRSSATSRKCRCDKAIVVDITSVDGTIHYDEAISKYDLSFVYKVNEIVEVPDYNEDRWNECSEGIHFFITRREAVEF